MSFSPFVSSLIRIPSIDLRNIFRGLSSLTVVVVLTSFLREKWNIIRLGFMFDCDHYKTAELVLFHCRRHMCGDAPSNRPSTRFISNNSSFAFCTTAKLIKVNWSWHIFESLRIHSQRGGKQKKGEIDKIFSRSSGVNRKWISDWALLATCKQQWWEYDFIFLLQSFAIAC